MLNNDIFETMSAKDNEQLGYVSVGYTLGEEILFTVDKQIRKESCFSETESCLLGIHRSKLAILQKELLDNGNTKDFYILESVLKGNYLLKSKLRKNMLEGRSENPGDINLAEIEGLQINYGNKDFGTSSLNATGDIIDIKSRNSFAQQIKFS